MEGSDGDVRKVDSSADRRGFAQLHRDMWRVVRTAPVIFLVVPAILGLPVDPLIETIAYLKPEGSSEQFRLYIWLNTAASGIVGTLTSAIALAALIDLSQGRQPTTGGSLREGLRLWSRIIAVFIAAGLRVALGALLLVIPGILLWVRYALAQPVAAFERPRPTEALKASRECVRRGTLSVVVWAIGATLLYLPVVLVPSLLVPGAAPSWVGVFANVPGSIFFFSLMTVGLTLLYADLREGPTLAPPIGSSWEATAARPQWQQSSGKGSVLVALAASGVALAGGAVAFYSLALAPITAGDEAWERRVYREALGHYERAIYWDPGDSYAHYRIGWCHQVLGHFEEALVAFDTAIELQPAFLDYQLHRARLLIQMDRVDDAATAIAMVRAAGGDEVVVGELEALLSERRPRVADKLLDRARLLIEGGDLNGAAAALSTARSFGGERVLVEELEASLSERRLEEHRRGQEAEAARSEELLRAIREEEERIRQLEQGVPVGSSGGEGAGY